MGGIVTAKSIFYSEIMLCILSVSVEDLRRGCRKFAEDSFQTWNSMAKVQADQETDFRSSHMNKREETCK